MIKVTEEQAEVIEWQLNSMREFAYGKGHIVNQMWLDLQYKVKGSKLDLVTIARIVEGEPYEVKREFKVGDIVQRDYSKSIIVVTEQFAKDLNKDNVYFTPYTLICKAENREDLMG